MISNSFFIFGPRGCGKSHLIKQLFQVNPAVFWIDLLEDDTYKNYLMHPEQLLQMDHSKIEWIVIDEVQRVPKLLNHVHKIIESDSSIKFALTGSSSRKLKREGANLLAGRAFENHLHPLVCFELGKDFILNDILNWGALPKVFSLKNKLEKEQFLRTYVNIYIKNEIKEEQAVRKLEPFLKFLEVAAQMNGKILNYSKIAKDCGVDSKAIERYFEILIDTLLGFYIEPYHESVRKRQSQKSKFYFFDLGVRRALDRSLTIPIDEHNYNYGNSFEHFIILEIIRLNDYHLKDFRFSYLRTKDDLEIDLIIDRPGKKKLCIEIKSTQYVDAVDINRYKNIKHDLGDVDFWFLTQEKTKRRVLDFVIFPWKEGLKEIFTEA